MLSAAVLLNVGVSCAFGVFQLDAPGRGPQAPPGSRSMALYPLPAVYLPGATCELRNVEPRNIAMCQKESVFVSALVSADGSQCANVGSVLRIDDVRPAVADTSGHVLQQTESARVYSVQCTVVGRVRIVGSPNLEAWRDWERARVHAEYLRADVVPHEDVHETNEHGAADTAVLLGQTGEEVADALYRLVDVLLASTATSEGHKGFDMHATVATLEEAASLAVDGRWWEAYERWQRYCTTRSAALAAEHAAERNELLVEAKLREGGALSLPINEATLDPADRARLDDLDARAADAAAQIGLHDAAAFQECLEADDEAQRATRLLDGVRTEADRLARKGALQRAFDAS